MKRAENDRKPINRFYRIVQSDSGLVDVWLTPGEPVPFWRLDGRQTCPICDKKYGHK